MPDGVPSAPVKVNFDTCLGTATVLAFPEGEVTVTTVVCRPAADSPVQEHVIVATIFPDMNGQFSYMTDGEVKIWRERVSNGDELDGYINDNLDNLRFEIPRNLRGPQP